ncbi:hypothetical protein BDA96_01G538400 [Sorghum bicolor]|uniref:Secreted peptide n=2 Tax=Sorghum bicolor TaxID=4558 RepID=A0A1B6QQI6_SORBI|nr:hypothetical protein BDA96_01G538400 [Sorghum bicolor]KXG40184.1 hypothetical protein SORBI_3001G504600 [Sorghum bicolor]
MVTTASSLAVVSLLLPVATLTLSSASSSSSNELALRIRFQKQRAAAGGGELSPLAASFLLSSHRMIFLFVLIYYVCF